MEAQTSPVQQDTEGRFLAVRSAVSGRTHRLPVIDVCKHLGGIATPVPEIAYRHSLALSIVRPLRARLFAAAGIPFSTRCHLLRSLAMSLGFLQRLWAKHYVALWRSLWRCGKGESYRHCYAVLGPAGAPTPPLALALAPAVLLRQIAGSGPSTLLHLLTVHWRESPRSSWLGQVLGDIAHVSQYVSAAGTLLGTGAPLAFLADELVGTPSQGGMPSCTEGFGCVELWCPGCAGPGGRGSRGEHRGRKCPSVQLPLVWGVISFGLRKHLGVHLARSHQIYSPARHLAHGTTCVSCLKCYHTVARHQQHLRTTSACMLRTCLLVPCLSIEEMHEEEGTATKRAKRIRGRAWTSYEATLPALQAQGPRQVMSRSSILIRTCFRGSSFSWPAGRLTVPEVAPFPFGIGGRSPVSPEFLCMGRAARRL